MKNDMKVFQIADDAVREMYFSVNSDSLMIDLGTLLGLIKRFRNGTSIDEADRYRDNIILLS